MTDNSEAGCTNEVWNMSSFSPWSWFSRTWSISSWSPFWNSYAVFQVPQGNLP